MAERGYHTYTYASEAAKDWNNKLDVVTSFDVIEHVDNPTDFMKDVYSLLAESGKAIIGTPTDCPIMRELIGKDYEQGLLYSFQHIWILSEDGFRKCCENAGFTKVVIKQYQRYGLSNMLVWLRDKKPKGHVKFDFVSDSLDSVYRHEIEKAGQGDYIVAYVEK